jgi:hypothetical protein
MTEAEARNLLRCCDNVRGIEVWISLQPWRLSSNGWAVLQSLEGWTFQLGLIPDGLQLAALPPSEGVPVVWLVPAHASKH